MDTIARYAKTVMAVVLPLLVNMVMDLVNGNHPWPQSGQEWLRYALSSIVVGLGVFGVPNTTHSPAVAAKESVRLRPNRHELPE
jgi:hypothetical protein